MNSFFHKTTHHAIYICRGAPTHLGMCKTHRTQNIRAPRLSWYSFGDICRPFQPSHLKNYEFHFSQKLFSKPSSYAVVHRPTWLCAKPTELKTFGHQEFHGIHLGTRPFQPSHLKNHEIHIFAKHPTISSNNVVVHRPTSQCAKPT